MLTFLGPKTRQASYADTVSVYGLLEYFRDAQVLQFDASAAEQFDNLHAASIRVGTMNLRIAAIALSRDMTILSRNTVDFERVPNLNFEDWTVR